MSPPIKNALVSVSDKTGLVELARELVAASVAIYSTGGTRRHLESAGVPVRDVAEYTGFPEMLDGRVKSLHPKVFAGILCRHDWPDDLAALAQHGIATFELVVVNLYPFAATIARSGVTRDEAIEQIDIGGPSLVRAAAKNYAFATIATDPSQYTSIVQQVRRDGCTTLELRERLAAAAFARTAEYDAAIARYFAAGVETGDGLFPPAISLSLSRREELRYGENPHQRAALYAIEGASGPNLVWARQLAGKELSYNNLLDLDSALAIAASLSDAAAVVIKHNNPCGAASAETLAVAMRRSLDGDPVSAFGSVIGVNRRVDRATAEVLVEPGRFIEAIVAPAYDGAAVELLTTKPTWKASVRLLEIGQMPPQEVALVYRQIDGGMLVQQSDTAADPERDWQIVTDAKPTDAQFAELRFGWAIVRHVKSNAIVLSRDQALCGVGAGQMSRVDSVEIAIKKAGDRATGAVLSSDAFFPFADSIELAAAAGVAAIIQPGGSRRDDEVIAACNRHGLPMVFTGRRHFKH